MDSLTQPNPNPTTEPQDSSLRPILVGIVIVGIVVGILAMIFRAEQKKPAPPPAYAANLKFSDLKTSAAQNFVGATVSYLDGAIHGGGHRRPEFVEIGCTTPTDRNFDVRNAPDSSVDADRYQEPAANPSSSATGTELGWKWQQESVWGP